MIANKSNLVAAERGFRTVFLNRLKNATGMRHPQMCMRMPSNAAVEEYDWLSDTKGMRELVGEAQVQGLRVVNWTVRNKEWEETVEVKEADIERDKLGLYNTRFEMMADNAAIHPDELLATTLKAGFTTPDWTGKHFFYGGADKYYPGTNKGIKNKVSGALTDEKFETARQYLREMKNAAGKSLNLGTDMVLVVAPKNETTALEILQAERTSNGATNVNKGTARLDVWPQLNAAGADDYWFLYDAGASMKPFVFQEEKATSLSMVTDPEDSYVMKTHRYPAQMYGRYNVGLLLPQLIVGSNGS